MLVTKCDICKKEIRGDIVLASVNYLTRKTFCLSCGKPVLNFLKNINKGKNGKQKRK